MSSTKWNTAEQWGKDHVLISSTETTEFPLRSKSQALGSGFTLHLKSRLFFSCSVRSDSLQPHWLQHARLPCPSPTPGACSNSCPSSQWCHPTISSSVDPSSPAFTLSQHQSLFRKVSSSHQVAKVLEFQLHHQSFQWTPGLISFRMHRLDLLAVQGTLNLEIKYSMFTPKIITWAYIRIKDKFA